MSTIRRSFAPSSSAMPPAAATFAFGFSGGAHLALRLALETPDLLTAITAVGANLPAPSGNDCRLRDAEMAPSLLLINGSADPINPWEGGRVLLPEALGGHDLGTVVSARADGRLVRPARRAGRRGRDLEAALRLDGNSRDRSLSAGSGARPDWPRSS
jgi:polyhydroxybutyrate depolymerase